MNAHLVLKSVYLTIMVVLWGQPLYDSKALFKLLALESQHAGLSWLTILKKKEAYEEAFYDFKPEKVAQMTTTRYRPLNDFSKYRSSS